MRQKVEEAVKQQKAVVEGFDLDRVLALASKRGASYADVRFQVLDNEVITVDNKVLESYASRRMSGVGIRVSMKGAVGYASTSDLSPANIRKTLNSAIRAAGATKAGKGEKEAFGKVKVNKANVKSPSRVDPFGVAPEEKVSVALDANKAAWIGEKIKNANTRLGLSKDFRRFASSEGADVRVETTIVGLFHTSVAQAKGVMEWAPCSESKCAGYEFIKSQDWNSFTEDVSKLSVEAVGAKTPPPGTHPVVVDPQTLGVLLHEAFGHASEGDLVSTGESVLNGKLGTQLASEHVTVVDEGVVDGGYYYPFDDEGTKKEKTVVVENGRLKNFLHDRNSASKLESKPTGNGRAMNFENSPIVRQTNYYMQNGDLGFEEIIEDIDLGLYIRGKGLMGGEVEVGMGTFTFNVGPSKVIRKGELAETVRGVVISGLILETMKTIDAVGNDLKFRTNVFGGCGKNDQTVPVGFGGPHIRIRRMTVGGR